jgi:hypothetical protein
MIREALDVIVIVATASTAVFVLALVAALAVLRVNDLLNSTKATLTRGTGIRRFRSTQPIRRRTSVRHKWQRRQLRADGGCGFF